MIKREEKKWWFELQSSKEKLQIKKTLNNTDVRMHNGYQHKSGKISLKQEINV